MEVSSVPWSCGQSTCPLPSDLRSLSARKLLRCHFKIREHRSLQRCVASASYARSDARAHRRPSCLSCHGALTPLRLQSQSVAERILRAGSYCPSSCPDENCVRLS
ncbi:hypothetical protein MPTK1_8g12530 [Marchantia polymorpha subsp. ruderalis]|uniref:Uncharacterized protein n=1 Tax=Marchantia polymorpha TaxID=3197 RepID=A0A2R6WJS0_MARPO|nr:hypothetical protein MARPO_0083s0067 [Marchantia polymorpha]BBN19660.1 hypothetical protein Mp_8g12530 [Marchantia polymorpha subsp. ruderalis]|eukprot:PTQ34107.1 hypothetical protein MARPO_0083s0067 [Marchantia polymorpha]